ncbi:MAG: DUF4136 domain-containing protein [Flavobacterium sp.]
MKTIRIILPLILLSFLYSCSSIRVASDYDSTVDFSQYKTFAFHANGIEKVPISEFDKKRIMKAIETELNKKGITKAENPDLLVNFFTKEREIVNVSQYYGYGWGWGYGWGGPAHVSSSTEGQLYIDFIDANKKALIWQGQGTGYLEQYSPNKDELIYEFVSKILVQYPPVKQK